MLKMDNRNKDGDWSSLLKVRVIDVNRLQITAPHIEFTHLFAWLSCLQLENRCSIIDYNHATNLSNKS